ncbi:hypothetical protein LTLLF_127055 [Microtus ochrogaster]|uniref:Uncharacterized protein n=1 Tax=Microtus ochrogaster TaxID=79684 RepID=A0A8J6GL42_MICOH|nr:hypothetical protein LTLLF_127055 [Microtus ochrogaster]
MQDQSRTNADNILRNSQEVSTDVNRQQEGLRPTDHSHSPWTDTQIRIILLLEWEVVEEEVGHPGMKIQEKTRLLCQRHYQWGLWKPWDSCFHLLLTLKNLHRSLCDERPKAEPLFSPLQSPCTGSWATDPKKATSQPVTSCPEYPPAPTELNFSQYQHWYHGFSPFSGGEFPGNPSQMMSSKSFTGSLPGVFRTQFPSGVSHGSFPPVFLETEQQPRAPSDDDQGPH